MVWALGTAATQSAGLCECLGWPAKSVSVGNAARNGLWSALLAEKGFAGPPEPLAGAQGFLAVMDEPVNWDGADRRPRQGLAGRQQFAQALSGGLRHSSAARPRARLAARQSRRRGREGRARGNPLLLQRTDRPDVETGRESQVSLQHARRRRAGAGQGGARPVHRCLRQRSRRVGDAPQDRGRRAPACRPSRPRWISSPPTARRTRVSTQAARGSAANPLKDSEIEDKLRTEAASWQKGHDIQPLIDAVWTIDKSDDVSTLGRSLFPLTLVAARDPLPEHDRGRS